MPRRATKTVEGFPVGASSRGEAAEREVERPLAAAEAGRRVEEPGHLGVRNAPLLRDLREAEGEVAPVGEATAELLVEPLGLGELAQPRVGAGEELDGSGIRRIQLAGPAEDRKALPELAVVDEEPAERGPRGGAPAVLLRLRIQELSPLLVGVDRAEPEGGEVRLLLAAGARERPRAAERRGPSVRFGAERRLVGEESAPEIPAGLEDSTELFLRRSMPRLRGDRASKRGLRLRLPAERPKGRAAEVERGGGLRRGSVVEEAKRSHGVTEPEALAREGEEEGRVVGAAGERGLEERAGPRDPAGLGERLPEGDEGPRRRAGPRGEADEERFDQVEASGGGPRLGEKGEGVGLGVGGRLHGGQGLDRPRDEAGVEVGANASEIRGEGEEPTEEEAHRVSPAEGASRTTSRLPAGIGPSRCTVPEGHRTVRDSISRAPPRPRRTVRSECDR